MGEDRIGKFGYNNIFQISALKGSLVQDLERLYSVIAQTFPKKEVSVVLGLGLIPDVFRKKK